MKIAHKPGELHGARFKRGGYVYAVLGSPSPDGYVAAIRLQDCEPAPVFLLAEPKPEEISPETPTHSAPWQDIGNISEVKKGKP